ncbi:MAG: GNAT family N-acetyltransferase [Pseudomonadota bacterium]
MPPDNISFRLATEADRSALGILLHETNQHYWGALNGAETLSRNAADEIVSGRSGCQAVLACVDDAACGFATFTVLHPALNASGTFIMKDLFVSKQARGLGLGGHFMRHLARMAVDMGCRRFDWTAETDNPRALAFYEELGAQLVAEKVYFRFCDDDLDSFIGSDGLLKKPA